MWLVEGEIVFRQRLVNVTETSKGHDRDFTKS